MDATPKLLYEDSLLLEEVSKGIETSFRRLYDKHHQKVYAFSLTLTRSSIIAEDLTQEIFLKVWEQRKTLRSINNFDSWLMVVARNHAYNVLNRMAKEQLVLKTISQHETATSEPVENYTYNKELSTLLSRAIGNLPPQQKKIYLLSRHDGLKHDEIARVTGLSTNTVKNHIKAALSSIRGVLDGVALILVFLLLCFFR